MTKAKAPAKKTTKPKAKPRAKVEAAAIEKQKPGRPDTYTDEAATEICQRLSGGEPLASICRDEHMPAVRTVSAWKKARESFAADFARAREDGHDAIAADCLRIADDGSQDFKPTEKGLAFDAEHVQRSKLRVETRLKLLAKWDPKRYGEKIEATHKGSVGVVLQTTSSDEAL